MFFGQKKNVDNNNSNDVMINNIHENEPIKPEIIEKVPDLYIKHDNNTFYFRRGNTPIGSFTIDDLILLTVHNFDKNKEFLKSNVTWKENSKLINEYLGSITFNKNLKDIVISFKNYNDSPFMGNFELVKGLINDLINYESGTFYGYLQNVQEEYKHYIDKAFKKLLYSIMLHAMKLISVLSLNADPVLKQQLFSFSMILNARITSYVTSEYDKMKTLNNEFKTYLQHANNVSTELKKKIESALTIITKHNIPQTIMPTFPNVLVGGEEKDESDGSKIETLSKSSDDSSSSSSSSTSSSSSSPNSEEITVSETGSYKSAIYDF